MIFAGEWRDEVCSGTCTRLVEQPVSENLMQFMVECGRRRQDKCYLWSSARRNWLAVDVLKPGGLPTSCSWLLHVRCLGPAIYLKSYSFGLLDHQLCTCALAMPNDLFDRRHDVCLPHGIGRRQRGHDSVAQKPRRCRPAGCWIWFGISPTVTPITDNCSHDMPSSPA